LIKKYGIIVVLVLIIIALMLPKKHTDERKILYYKNPMDPTITSPVFKQDEMGMDYLPVYADGTKPTEPKKGINISPENTQRLSIKTTTVQRMPMSSTFTAAGSVAYDPELYVAQEEYIQMLQTMQSNAMDSAQIKQASRQKLLLAGMTSDQIDRLALSKQPDKSLYLPSQNSSVWVYFNIFEKDTGLIRLGQDVSIFSVGLPGITFSGRVEGFSPIIDPTTRSLKARALVKGAAGQLKPGMFVSVRVSVGGPSIVAVDEDAVLDTGTKSIVYLEVEDGRFEEHPVQTGRRSSGKIEIISGLNVGDRVVEEGSFFVDSESKLQGK